MTTSGTRLDGPFELVAPDGTAYPCTQLLDLIGPSASSSRTCPGYLLWGTAAELTSAGWPAGQPLNGATLRAWADTLVQGPWTLPVTLPPSR